MANIYQLSTASTLQPGDQMAVWSMNNGDSRKVSISALSDYIQIALNVPGGFQTQYAAPNALSLSVLVNSNSWLLLTPTVALAALELILPPSPTDGAEIKVTCTQEITSLTVSVAEATVTGAPTTIAAKGFFTMRFDTITHAWYRVG